MRIFDTSSALTNLDYAPVDVYGVNRIRAELGDLTVRVHPVLLVDEGTSGVGGNAAPITNADKVSREAGTEPDPLDWDESRSHKGG